MAEFYNPYQFIEFTGKVNGENVSEAPFDDIKQGDTHIRHDYWQAHDDIHHGRILCQIKILSPTLTGNKHKKDDPVKTTVKQYRFNKEPAIQANSLRGMIGNLIETLSQSSMRVLSNRNYSLSVGKNEKRKEIAEPTFDFFSVSEKEPSNKNYSNALPWGSTLRNGRERNGLTPAGVLLGVVAVKDQENAGSPETNSQNLASRIRFSDALGTQIQVIDQPIPLKILSSPKPNGSKVTSSEPGSKEAKATPSACMYFKPRNGSAYIASKNLSATQHEANGRKFYLPHKTVDSMGWREKTNGHENQKVVCQPIAEKQKLYFHIDFNNVTSKELVLVQTAVQPAENYQHTLGLGKSLGLGQVKLKIRGTFFIDRQQRYSMQPFAEGRYQALNKGVDQFPADSLLTQRYAEEVKAFTQVLSPRILETDTTLIDNTTHQQLKKLGNTFQQRLLPICFPYTNDQKAYNENKSFQWFVENKKWHQFLPTLNTGDKIPTLTTDGKQSIKPHNIQINLLSATDHITKDELVTFIKQQLKINNIHYSTIASNQNKDVRLLVAGSQIKQVCQHFIKVKIKETYRLNCREL